MNVSGEFLLPALTGYISTSQKDMQRFQEFFVTSAKAANFPWQSQALWFFSQMLRWGKYPPVVVSMPRWWKPHAMRIGRIFFARR